MKEPLTVAQTDNVTIISGEGRTLMPGLTDCRWHNMAAYMDGDVFAAGAGKLNLVAARGAERSAYADLLLVDGNPLEDINLIADPHKNFVIIMKDGVIYKNTLK